VSTIHRHVHQGQFGEDYVRVLATAAGFVVSDYRPDVDGVDLGIVRAGDGADVRAPRIDVQVKTVSNLLPVDGVFRFDGLSGWQYNKLAGPGFVVPRYLFLITVPKEAGRYADLNPNGLLLRHIGYFTSLHECDKVPEGRRSVRVRVPTANVLTVARLQALVQGVR
jgi:hypothetical protein